MANFRFYTPVDSRTYDNLAIASKTILSGTDGEFTFAGTGAGQVIRVIGSSFKYADGRVISGRPTLIVGTTSGSLDFQAEQDFGEIARFATLSPSAQIDRILRGSDYLDVRSAGGNTVRGGDGNDIFNIGLGVNIVDGGAGNDTVNLRIKKGDAQVSYDGTGRVIIDGPSGSRDVLSNVEQFKFSDQATSEAALQSGTFGTVNFSFNSTGGAVFALYKGLLDRAPDPLGAEAYAARIDDGESLRDVAKQVLESPEGQRLFGNRDDASFVTQLYATVLNRSPDATGLNQWLQQLASGVSRADVAVGFVFSAEHASILAPTFSAGVFIPDQDAADVARLTYGILDRAPQVTELDRYTAAVKSGAPLQEIARQLLVSDEYAALNPGQTDKSFVDALYQHILDRPADAAGEQAWLDKLGQGESRSSVAASFVGSQEFQSRYAGRSDGEYVDALYARLLGRDADASGRADWVRALGNHTESRIDVGNAFASSDEYRLIAGPDRTAAIDALYEGALGRAPDAGGLQSYLGFLNGSGSLADVAVSISESPEAKDHLLAAIEINHQFS